MSGTRKPLTKLLLQLVLFSICQVTHGGDQTANVWLNGTTCLPPDDAEWGQIVNRIDLRPEDPADGANTGSFSNTSEPCLLFITAGDGASAGAVFIGKGHSVAAAVTDAIGRLKDNKPTLLPRYIKIDFVDEVIPVEGAGTEESPYLRKRSLWGLAAAENEGVAILPEELVSATIVNSKQRFREDRYQRFVEKAPHRVKTSSDAEPPQWRYRFSTKSYLFADNKIEPLYRGHRTGLPLDPDSLLESAVQGGDYLSVAVTDSGRYIYSYLPKSDRNKDKYNMLRHGGTTFSLYELYTATGNEDVKNAADRALKYLQQQTQACGEDHLCVVDGNDIKLGGNALAILALTERMRVDPKFDGLPTAHRLARWILSTQAEDGSYRIHKMTLPDYRVSDFRSQYYPGETIFALVRLYQRDGNREWLDSAVRNARYLIQSRLDTQTEDLPHDHWLLYGLRELQREAPDPLWRQHSTRLTQAILTAQNLTPEYPDWYGSFYRPPRSTPTATRTEGLIAAFDTMDATDMASKSEILKGICVGVRFQRQTQMDAVRSLYLPDPSRGYGGFSRSLTDFELRIDYTQHNISSLLGLRRILLANQLHCPLD